VSRNFYSSSLDELDEYEVYAEQFDPLKTDRQARRKRKPKAHHVPKKAKTEVLDDVAATTGVEGSLPRLTSRPGLSRIGCFLRSAPFMMKS